MAIRGTLGEATLADILQLLALGRKTGSLSVFDAQNFGRIYLRNGRVISASIVNRRDRLGDLLLRSGVVTPEALQSAVDQQKGSRPRRLGQILLERHAITAEQLEKFIAMQVEEAVYTLFGWASGTFHFDPDVAPDPGEHLVSLNPERLLLEGARRVDEWSVIRKRIPSLELIFDRSPEALVEGGLTGEQSRLAPLLDGERNAREAIEASGLLEFEGVQALFGLLQAGIVRPTGRRTRSESLEPSAVVEEHERLGTAYYETGMFEEAAASFARALEADPTATGPRFQLSCIEMRRGAYREAIRRLMELISDGRLAPAVFLNLGLCLEAVGRQQHALVTVEEGLRSYPGHPQLLLSRAILLTKLRKPRSASAAFEALRRGATHGAVLPAPYFVFACLALAAMGNLQEAAERADEGLQYYPRHPALLLHAAVIQERMDHADQARALFERALQENPSSHQIRRGLADTLYRTGRVDAAAEIYAALLADGGGAEIHFRLGQIAYDGGRRDEAIAYWRGAVQADPTHVQARTRLRLLEGGTPSGSASSS